MSVNPTDAPRCPICAADLTEAQESDNPFLCSRSYCGVSLLRVETQQLQINTFQMVDHYSDCVLPFSFIDIHLEAVLRRLREGSRWTEKTFSEGDEGTAQRIDYFLPYIREFLFPKAKRLVDQYLERGTNDGTSSRDDTVSHWEFSLEQLGDLENGRFPFQFDCVDNRNSMSFSWPMVLESVKLIVFGYRVGFLVLRFRCRDHQATFFDQMSSLSYLRPIMPLYGDFAMGVLTSGDSQFVMPQLLAYLLGEFKNAFVPAHPSAVTLPTSLPVQPAYDDRMMVYTFSCLNKETGLEDLQQAEKLLNQATVVNFDGPNDNLPLGPDGDPREDWFRERRQGYSKEGTCLVVFDTDKYHKKFLGSYHATYYFDIFLLSTLQRVTLLTLYGELSRISALTTGSKHRRALRRILRDLLLFKNQCCFSQITNRERGLTLWQCWQGAFENKTLLDEVNDQAAELNTYLQGRSRERLEGLLRAGGFVAAAIPIILGLNVFLPGQELTILRWSLLLAVVLGSGLFVLFSLFRDRD